MTPGDIDTLIRNEHLNLSAKTNIDVSVHLESRIKQLEKKILADTIGKPYYLKLLTYWRPWNREGVSVNDHP